MSLRSLDILLNSPDIKGKIEKKLGATVDALSSSNTVLDFEAVMQLVMEGKSYNTAFNDVIPFSPGQAIQHFEGASHSFVDTVGAVDDVVGVIGNIWSVYQRGNKVRGAYVNMREKEGERANTAVLAKAVFRNSTVLLDNSLNITGETSANNEVINKLRFGTKGAFKLEEALDAKRDVVIERVDKLQKSIHSLSVSSDIGIVELAMMKDKLDSGDSDRIRFIDGLIDQKIKNALQSVPDDKKYSTYAILKNELEIADIYSRCERVRRKETAEFGKESVKLGMAATSLIVNIIGSTVTFGSATVPITMASKALGMVSTMMSVKDIMNSLNSSNHNLTNHQTKALAKLLEGKRLSNEDLEEIKKLNASSDDFNNLMNSDLSTRDTATVVSGYPRTLTSTNVHQFEEHREIIGKLLESINEPFTQTFRQSPIEKHHEAKQDLSKGMSQHEEVK